MTTTTDGTAGTGTTGTPAAGAATAAPAPAAGAAAPAAAGTAAPVAGAAGTTALTTGVETAKAGEGAAGTKDGEAKATETAPTNDIKITVPEGVKLDEGLLKNFTPIAQELGLKSEGAQKLVDLFVKSQADGAKLMQEQHFDTITKWAEEAKADKEIGNTNWDANLKAGQYALSKLGTPELKTLLDSTGLGNHKSVIAFFAKVGKSLSEDSLSGTGAGAETGGKFDPETGMYPTMKKS